ncbi:AraC family transcriptional regulator of adaptative response/methylated-DNA-[protein]-cysteine methyltransferase [Acinetobacter calcoaceticus]|uniref:methylated-DNA--[protein]-cysteine S-methyltransferase n=1 Tax=Acinetobacter calcoaceticus TaxID=471 RepID=A0A4R1XU38_ACICA|nr:AraC family transcriptional regulator of adaptative response/methylated-DNA-[protein]-cysteine methyltransferase [Acinetobacter calcoaceticus]
MTLDVKHTQRHYARISQAIDYLQQNFQQQPSLQQVAAHIHLSPAHFQRLFSEWAGTSPKKFLQYLSVEHAKKLLKQSGQQSLMQASLDTGLSSTSRLHDLFIQIEGMTPAQYKNGGLNVEIHYSQHQTLFGPVLIASTDQGICFLSFEQPVELALQQLRQDFPHARLSEQSDAMQQNALAIFHRHQIDTEQADASDHVHPIQDQIAQIKLHLKGSEFQLKVWQSLLNIPMGQLSSYGQIAAQIGQPSASRAVGTAIGHNPVAFLIPCHRVIQASGQLGGYRWGETRKKAMIAWEGAQTDDQD